MTKNKTALIFSLIFIGFVVWWASFQHVVAKLGLSVQWFGYTYGIVALLGSIIGIIAAKKWGGFKTVLGKALTFFSLGLFAQEAGQLIYAYYIVVDKIQIPYPSWGDVAYFGSTLLYITAALYLAKASGVKFSLKDLRYKLVAVVIPVILLVSSYLILLHNHHFDTSKPLTVFLDAGYPIGEALYISIGITAYFLSRKLLGGIMKSGILWILFALLIQYVSDFTFVYQSNRNTYIPGKYDDLLYLIAYYVMSLALLKFYLIYKSIANKSQSKEKLNEAQGGSESGAHHA